MPLKRAVVFVALALAVYANALNGSFHFDDRHAVQENPSIRSLGNLGRFFADVGTFSVVPQNQEYRPVLLISYAVTAAIAGVRPAAFIAGNLLIHIACALLVGATLRLVLGLIGRERNADSIAFLAALIFAVHPCLSECVNYVSARSESLSAALVLACVYAYLRGRADERWMTVAVLAILAALLTKPTAVVLPGLLVLLEVAAATRRPLRRIAPWLGALTATVAITTAIAMGMRPTLTEGATEAFTRLEYLRSELPAYWYYVRLFVWPVGLSVDPGHPLEPSFLEPRVIASGLALLAAGGFALWGLWRRRQVGLALALAWFLVCLAPTSTIIPLAEIVNGHRAYLASAALCALAAWLLIEVLPRVLGRGSDSAGARTVAVAASALVIASLGTATLVRNRAWRSEVTLWADVVSKTPQSTRAQSNLGLALMYSGQLDEADSHLREALRLSPDDPMAHIGLGCLLLNRSESSQAAPLFERAVALNPSIFWGHYYRGIAGETLSEPPAALVGHFQTATQLSPSFADGWYHLALARQAAKDDAGALEAVQHAVALRGSHEDRFVLAQLLLRTGNAKAARRLFEQLLLERPDDAQTRQLLQAAAQATKPG